MNKKHILIGTVSAIFVVSLALSNVSTQKKDKLTKQESTNEITNLRETGDKEGKLSIHDDKDTLLDQIYQMEVTKGYTDIRRLPAKYTYEQALKDHCYISDHINPVETNQALYDSFTNKIKNKQSAFIRIVQITVEGDFIIVDVLYDSDTNRIFLVKDDTRDRYLSLEESVISIMEYTENGIWNYENPQYQINNRYWIVYNHHPNDVSENEATVEDYFIIDNLK